MNTLQKVEFELLKAFIDTCDKLGLQYFLLGGTLIGAVRHKGFIPWDDDIDVGMLREDYDRFLEHAQEHLPKNLFLQTYETDPEYPQFFAKLRDSSTTFIEKSVCKKRMNHGVYIDIFPLDSYPNKTVSVLLLRWFRRIINYRLNQEYYIQPRPFKVKYLVFFPISRFLYPSSQSVLRSFDRTIRKVPKTELLCNYYGAWGDKEISQAIWFSSSESMLFEGISVSVPIGYNEYLHNVYGDYMQLPPIEKQVGHHFAEKIDIHKPYTFYLGEE